MSSTLTLEQLDHLLLDNVSIKRRLLDDLLEHRSGNEQALAHLQSLYQTLIGIQPTSKAIQLNTDQGWPITVDLHYEIEELRRDLLFLEHRHHFWQSFPIEQNDWRQRLLQGQKWLKDLHPDIFITDRDGTINNYCGRYNSSTQSIYNAFILAQWHQHQMDTSCIITSAPLRDTGLMDLNILPDHPQWILAGSKGREYHHPDKGLITQTMSPEEQAALDQLNADIRRLLSEPAYRIFSLIGSGYQKKFGQITLARQDIHHSISDQDSQNWMQTIQSLVKQHDPDGERFRIEDTGKDIEIMLTISDHSEAEQRKDFDKGDGLAFIEKSLPLTLKGHRCLVCGDTASDIALVRRAQSMCEKVGTIFVTTDDVLKSAVKTVARNALFVDCPDELLGLFWELCQT